jgi:hypothetical protein
MKKHVYYIVFFLIGFFYGCHDAPRDNPLDPQSPQYISTASVTGTVSILNQSIPLPSATITSIENGVSTVSNASGAFSFDHLTIGTQTLICTKPNYTPDTLHIVLQAQTTAQVHFSLNGAPYIVSQNIYTRKIDQYYPSPQYFVDVTASVADPNGITDIDSVWFCVTYPSTGSLTSDTLLFPMTYSVSTRLFQITIYKYDLPTNTIQWLVNKPLQIRSTDFHYAINYSVPFHVSRVIEDAATPTYPTLNTTTSAKDTTGPTPLLKWSSPDVTFNYTYSLTISRITSGVHTDVWSYTQLGSINNEFQFPGDNRGETLDPGEYVWTILVVDDFGNYSRSKEASFVVK